MSGHASITITQVRFRGRTNDASLASGTYTESEDTNYSVDGDTRTRIRFLLQETGGGAGNDSYELWYSKNSGTYAQVLAASANCALALTSGYADGDTLATADFDLTAGSGTAFAGIAVEDPGPETGNIAHTANGYTELEFCFELPSADNSDGDTFDFEVRDGAGTQLNAYTIRPRVTVNIVGTDVLTADDLASGTPNLDSPAIGQTHVLSANDLAAGTPNLDTPAIGQIHGLTANDLAAGTPNLGNPAVGESHVLDANDLASGAPSLTSPAIGQVHALNANDLATAAPSLGNPAISQIHVLTANDLATAAPNLSNPNLTEVSGTDPLLADDLASGVPNLENPNFGQVHVLTADDLSAGVPNLGNPAIGEPAGATRMLRGFPVFGAGRLIASKIPKSIGWRN